ncbi:uncharacterized protein [Typha angustifolia]|uniref:uncharacterized protein n=1 Tax=Typha angustifolia TaxID=59011 RepID=UPI003C3089FF
MASEEEGGGGDGSSLFEGMVLFSPSEEAPPSPPPPPIPTAAAPMSLSRPLDEDLFSDLSLQIHTDPLPPASDATPPPSRQLSRKKKRAVRIGYGRDAAVAAAPPDEPHFPSSFPAPLSPQLLPPAEPSPQPAHDSPPPPPHLTNLRSDPQPEEEAEVGGGESDAILQEDIKVEEEEKEEKVPSAAAPSQMQDSCGPIEERLALIRARISQKFESIRQRAASVTAERKELGRRRRKVAEDVNSASARYKELERELEEACEAEDFDKAERVSESLAAVEKDKDNLLAVLRQADLDCDSVDSKMQEVLELQIAAEEEAVTLLEQFAKDAADFADLVSKNAEEVFSKELEGWQTSIEILEIKKLEMEIESQLVCEAHLGLEEAIEHLVEDDRREKYMLRSKGDILAKELGELLELVRLKEAEIAENDSQIQEVQKRISGVVAEFHMTQSSIDMKRDNLQAAQSKMASENAALVMKRKEIDDFVSVAEQKRSKLMELANVSSDEAKSCQNFVELRRSLASSIVKSRQDRVKFVKTEEKILEDIQILRQQISAARTSLQELSSTRASMQQEIASLKQRVSFIDKRGPELEAEKKVAAAARNFKEAGRIAAEAKALNVEKEDLQNKLEKSALDLQKLEEEINGTADKVQESEGLILLKEKEAAMASYKRLQLVSAAARAERTAALGMGDLDECDVLLKEAEAAECKARELQESYELQPEDDGSTLQPVVSIAFITNVAGQYLAEMVSSFNIPCKS